MIDETHDPRRESWVASARGHAEFPIQNLPFGVFSLRGGAPRGGVAIGDKIFDLRAGLEAGLFSGDAATAAEAGGRIDPEPADAARQGSSPRFAQEPSALAVRRWPGAGGSSRSRRGCCTMPPSAPCICRQRSAASPIFCRDPPCQKRRHAPRSEQPAQPQLQIRTGRLSQPGVLGAALGRADPPPERPAQGANEDTPSFGPAQKLDYELELAVWIGPGNELGEPIPIARGGGPRFGLGLVNDWSARDVQVGNRNRSARFSARIRHNGLALGGHDRGARPVPRRHSRPRPAGDPQPLPYLWDEADQRTGAFDIALEALLMTEGLRAKGLPPHRMSASNTTDLYWTIAQLVAHHTCGGCNLLAGDLFGTGTISGPLQEGYGSLMELSADGQRRDNAGLWRNPHLSRKRRRGDLPRPLPQDRLCVRSALASAAPELSSERAQPRSCPPVAFST